MWLNNHVTRGQVIDDYSQFAVSSSVVQFKYRQRPQPVRCHPSHIRHMVRLQGKMTRGSVPAAPCQPSYCPPLWQSIPISYWDPPPPFSGKTREQQEAQVVNHLTCRIWKKGPRTPYPVAELRSKVRSGELRGKYVRLERCTSYFWPEQQGHKLLSCSNGGTYDVSCGPFDFLAFLGVVVWGPKPVPQHTGVRTQLHA